MTPITGSKLRTKLMGMSVSIPSRMRSLSGCRPCAHVSALLVKLAIVAFTLWVPRLCMATPRAFARGFYEFQAHQYRAAVRLFFAGLRIAPNNGLAHYYLAKSLLKAFRKPSEDVREQALLLFTQAALLLPSSSQRSDSIAEAAKLSGAVAHHYADRGRKWFQKGEFSRTVRDSTIAIELSPTTSANYTLRAEAYKGLGKFGAAIDDFSLGILLAPERAENYIDRGYIYSDIGKYASALKDCKKAISLERREPDRRERSSLYLLCGRAHGRLGQAGQATFAYKQMLRLHSRNAMAYADVGSELRRVGRLGDAIHALDEAIRLDPTAAWMYNQRGLAYAANGQGKRAIRDYNEAIRLDPTLRAAYTNRAWVRKWSGPSTAQ